ncbi:MAG: Ig-like domain-containing protein, partial [Desulfobulbales bacterium]|nr:Ig-like domain-containing protein [Desulfobulbales bacterium]
MSYRLAALIALVLLFSGCSADDPTRDNTFIPLTSITITSDYAAMADRTVNQYRAEGDFSGVISRDLTADVVWRIDDKKSEIASVSNNFGTEGLVTALLPGETSVIARYEDFSVSAPVVVTNAFLVAIAIVPQDHELQVGVTAQYTAEGTFSDDTVQDISIPATWESSDEAVATIDDTGLLQTQGAGVSTISASWDGIEASTGLLVADATLTAISINPEEATIAQGTTVQYEAEAVFSDDSTLDITDIIDWQSVDAGIAVVDAGGLATGVAPGETEISGTYAAGGETTTATAALTVTDAVIETISITPENSTIGVDESLQLTATGTFSDGNEQDITDLASWSTSEINIGTISNTSASRGLFTSIDSGNTIIAATFGGVSGDTL